MKKTVLLLIIVALTASCGQRSNEKQGATQKAGNSKASDTRTPAGTQSGTNGGAGGVADLHEGADPAAGADIPGGADLPAGAVLIATGIVTEVVIRPDPEGDPWETEKVAGYKGDVMVEGIFSRIYDGSLTVYDYHSGEPLKTADVKKIEAEFQNDRTKIGKLSFTEDWYYYPAENRVEKKAKSVTFGYELYNNLGKVYAYKAAFRADLN